MLGHYPSWLSNGSPWPPPAAGISLGEPATKGARGGEAEGRGADAMRHRTGDCWTDWTTGALI